MRSSAPAAQGPIFPLPPAGPGDYPTRYRLGGTTPPYRTSLPARPTGLFREPFPPPSGFFPTSQQSRSKDSFPPLPRGEIAPPPQRAPPPLERGGLLRPVSPRPPGVEARDRRKTQARRNVKGDETFAGGRSGTSYSREVALPALGPSPPPKVLRLRSPSLYLNEPKGRMPCAPAERGVRPRNNLEQRRPFRVRKRHTSLERLPEPTLPLLSFPGQNHSSCGETPPGSSQR